MRETRQNTCPDTDLCMTANVLGKCRYSMKSRGYRPHGENPKGFRNFGRWTDRGFGLVRGYMKIQETFTAEDCQLPLVDPSRHCCHCVWKRKAKGHRKMGEGSSIKFIRVVQKRERGIYIYSTYTVYNPFFALLHCCFYGWWLLPFATHTWILSCYFLNWMPRCVKQINATVSRLLSWISRCSPARQAWIKGRKYQAANIWRFRCRIVNSQFAITRNYEGVLKYLKWG